MQIRRALAACAVVLLLICGCRGGSANVKTTTSTVSIGQQLIDLKQAYDRQFGGTKPLRFGHVYRLLSQLVRDGHVVAVGVEPGAGPDRKTYAITEAGVTEFETWLAEPVMPEPHLQTVLFAKVVLALMLGRRADQYLDAQRAAHLQRMRELTELKQKGALVDALLADHGLFHLEADLRWIDMTAARLDALAQVVSEPVPEVTGGSR